MRRRPAGVMTRRKPGRGVREATPVLPSAPARRPNRSRTMDDVSWVPPFPTWVMAIRETYNDRGLPNALMLLSQDGHPHKVLPLFTNERAAHEYIEDSDFDDC